MDGDLASAALTIVSQCRRNLHRIRAHENLTRLFLVLERDPLDASYTDRSDQAGAAALLSVLAEEQSSTYLSISVLIDSRQPVHFLVLGIARVFRGWSSGKLRTESTQIGQFLNEILAQ